MSEKSTNPTVVAVHPPYNVYSPDSPLLSPSIYSNKSPFFSFINVRHPYYNDVENILFTLPLVDYGQQEEFPATGPATGIHFGTIITACHIVACNADGSLFVDSTLQVPIRLGWDDLLSGYKDVYFHPAPNQVTAAVEPYPICPEFSDWVFPQGIPDPWTTAVSSNVMDFSTVVSQMSEAVSRRDIRCRMTLCTQGTEVAHIVPKKEYTWFSANGMTRFNQVSHSLSGTSVLHDPSNGLLLRADLHALWDRRIFALVPKMGSLVVHNLTRVTEISALYHNRRVHEVFDIAPEFLYARFAWALFTLLGPFNTIGCMEKRVRVRVDTESNLGVNQSVMRDEWRAPAGTISQGGKEGKKRKAQGDDIGQQERRRTWSGRELSMEPPESMSSPISSLAGGDDRLTRTDDEARQKAQEIVGIEHPSEVWESVMPKPGGSVDGRLVVAVELELEKVYNFGVDMQ